MGTQLQGLTISDIRINSLVQLFSHDLAQKSNPMFFNDDGRALVLQAAPSEPWAGVPADGVSQ